MENLINFQQNLYERMTKAKINFKKSPKERITKEYVDGRMEMLDQLWFEFLSGHKDLMRNYTAKEINASTYVTNDLYDKTEEFYLDYKCDLKILCNKFESKLVAQTSESICNSSRKTNANYPQINIPYFSGNYQEWTSFKSLFISLVINNESFDDVHKLHYLKAYLKGEPEQLVRHVAIEEGNFNRCWEIINERYNDKKWMCYNILKRFMSQRNLTTESGTGLKDLVDTTNECLASLESLGVKINSWDVIVIHIINLKLDPETRRQWEFHVTAKTTSNELPTYHLFESFLKERFSAINRLDSKTHSNNKPNVSNVTTKMKTLHIAHKHIQNTKYCAFCKNDHRINQCTNFHKSSVEVRRKFVLDNKLCFNCLGGNHSAKECHSKIKCRVCKRAHNSLLHPQSENAHNEADENVASSSETSVQVVSCVASSKITLQRVLLATALVRAASRSGENVILRALIDQGSQASFVTESTVQYLGLKKVSASGQITGLGGGSTVISKAVVDILLRSLYEPNFTITVRAHVINKRITSFLPSKKVEVLQWDELQNLNLADPEYHTPNRIDILLGAEVHAQIIQDGIKKGPFGAPLAQSTNFGWIISGVVNDSASPSSQLQTFYCYDHTGDDTDLLKKFWELETDIPMPKQQLLTEEEQYCEEHFQQTTTRDAEGRYIVRLPFKNENPQVKSSREIAEKRLKSLENRLNTNINLKMKYTEVIEEYIGLKHIEVIPENEINRENAIYLPHHAVIKEDKTTTKVRVVFDASCKGKNNLSLNNQLLVGPTIQPELRHIIMQWRMAPICLSADIVKMYRQVKTDERDNDYQRILWRKNSNENIQHYRLTRVTFGTASAPYLAVKALQQVARDHNDEYPVAAQNTLNNFYVDDLMTGVQSVPEGIVVFTEMNELLKKAGFELQKWNTNNNDLMEIMKGKGMDKVGAKGRDMEIKEDELMKIMGLTFNRTEDNFRFVVNLPTLLEPVTKRKILSDIARLYDPLGWVAPSLILAKILIQKLWLAGIGWDEAVPDKLLNEWVTYRGDQIKLCEIRIPRWVSTSNSDRIVELHGFCDASKSAFAAAVYIRTVGSEGKINVSLFTAKTRVAPVKQVSIPRLELCGAVLLTKLLTEVATILNIKKQNLHAWTDSTVVLSWLNKHPSKWSVFVANRVAEILTYLEPQHWSHVSTKHNPADCASRGLRPSELLNNCMWFYGPEFLSNETIIYSKPKSIEIELEAIKTHCTTLDDNNLINRFSSLTKARRVMAYCMRFINNLKKTTNKIMTTYLNTTELNGALNLCIRNCQSNSFSEDIKKIKKKRDLPRNSKIWSLTPFIDEQGILRVGGRLNQTNLLTFNRKHPILLSKQCHLAKLIIDDAHKHTLHGGPQVTLNYIQTRYWIIGAKQLVKAHYRNCVICVKNAAITKSPLRGQLPPARITPSRAFSNSGVDYAGPIQIRTSKGRGHKSHKGYIALFICMATRAIHLEVVSDLTSEGFLQAFKRFVARRGHCSHLWSDNGTNFIGASTELKKLCIAEQKQMMAEVAEALANNQCEWHFIPPHSPNFGGLWEAGVKSVKYHLKRVVGNSTLTYEEMSTVLTQIEACLNSRPLSAVLEDSDKLTVLTPGHFLIGEAILTVPDQNFFTENVSSLRRWQHSQRVFQSFWRQWSQEYLTKFLQHYGLKPTNIQQPKVGDIVVIKEDNMPPSRWLYGRVIAVHPGSDQIVRVVTLKTKSGLIKRPTCKLCILPIATD